MFEVNINANINVDPKFISAILTLADAIASKSNTLPPLNAIQEAVAPLQPFPMFQEPIAPAPQTYQPTYTAPVNAGPVTVPTMPPVNMTPVNPVQVMAPANPTQVMQTMAPQTMAAPQPAQIPSQPPTAAPTYTHEQLGHAGSLLCDAGKRQDVLNLLREFGAPKVTDLPPHQLGPFATRLRQMGAKL